MLSRIKSMFVKEKGLGKDQMAILGALPPGERPARLGIVLHEICVKKAARFVEEEHQRPDSPFEELPKTALFHEMLVMGFWVFEWLFKGTRQEVMEHLYRHYNASFIWGLESSHKEQMESMRVKFRIYDKAWDDYAGHQDVFARKALDIIFGGKQIATARQAAFWIIIFADQTMKDFTEIRNSVDQLLPDMA